MYGKECPVKFLNTSLSCPFISHPSVPKGIYGTVRDVTQSSTFLGSTDTSFFICRDYISFPSVWGQPSLHFFKLLYNCSGDLNASHTWSWVLAITQIVKSTYITCPWHHCHKIGCSFVMLSSPRLTHFLRNRIHLAIAFLSSCGSIYTSLIKDPHYVQ